MYTNPRDERAMLFLENNIFFLLNIFGLDYMFNIKKHTNYRTQIKSVPSYNIYNNSLVFRMTTSDDKTRDTGRSGRHQVLCALRTGTTAGSSLTFILVTYFHSDL